jgi:hypothetical protein
MVRNLIFKEKGEKQLKIETGGVYRVKHRRKGDFCICVQFTDKNFTTGTVIEGKVQSFEVENEVFSGGQVTVRNSFCKFTRVHITKGAIL